MADTLEVEIKGLDRLLKKFGAGATPIIRTLTRGVAEQIKAELSVSPPPVKYPIKWASAKQRRWYFATHKGKVPYVRGQAGEKLNQSWTTEQRGEVGAVVGTKVKYAAYVQRAGSGLDISEGEKVQQPMHANTGWVTDEQAVQKVNDSGVAERLLSDIIRKW